MTDYSNETPEETIERLTIYSQRLHQSVLQAKVLYSCFQSLNENRELRERIGGTTASTATNTMMHAMLRELTLILVRVFDGPGRYPIEKSDKVTFPIVAAWLEQPAILEGLLERARHWLDDGFLAEENQTAVRDAVQRLKEGLVRLREENPNRQKLLRDFRDGFLAHELHRAIPRDPPLFGHIGEMLEEIRLLSETTSLAIEGSAIHWDLLDEQVGESADWLWSRVGGQ